LERQKFLWQKLKNGFAAGDAHWRVHSMTPTEDKHASSDVHPCFVLKGTKLRKIGLPQQQRRL